MLNIISGGLSTVCSDHEIGLKAIVGITEIAGLTACSKRQVASCPGTTGGQMTRKYPCAKIIRYMATLQTSEATWFRASKTSLLKQNIT